MSIMRDHCCFAGAGLRTCGAAFAVLLLMPGAASVRAQDTPSGEAKPSDATLSIATWGGAYGQSQEIAYFEPFAKEDRRQDRDRDL